MIFTLVSAGGVNVSACHGQSHLVNVVDAEVGLGEVACADGRTHACHLFNHQALKGEQKVG